MGDQSNSQSQNRIKLPRVISALLVPFLLAAGLILYLLPDRTQEFFAWTIQPPLTALVMGAGYLSGAYFFLRAVFKKDWESVRLGFLPIAAFAWLSAATTLIHWDRFNQSHITFYAWVALYAITPLLVPAIWWMNHTDPSLRVSAKADISQPVAYFLGAAGLLALLTGLVLFSAPQLLIPVWPWDLTPLTARVIGSWFVMPGLVDIAIAVNRRWRSVRLVMESQLLGLALLLVGFLRGFGNLHLDNPLSWSLVGGLCLLALGLLLLYLLGWRNGKAGELKVDRREKAG
jgi:hypothetical protein